MKYLAITLSCLLTSVEAFSPVIQKNAVSSQHKKAFFIPTHEDNCVQIARSTRDLSRQSAVEAGDIIFPCMLMLAAVAATVTKADQNDANVPSTPTPKEMPAPIPVPPPAPSAKETVVPSPKAAPIPAPKPVPTPETVVVTGKVDVSKSDVKTPVAPAVIIKAPNASDLTKLKMEIASTKSGQMEKEARLQQSFDEEKVADETIKETVVEESVPVVETKKRGFRGKAFRILKKVVAPWRKWSNIQ